MNLDRSKAPEQFSFSCPDFIFPEKISLSNHIPCCMWQQDDYKLIRLDVRVKAGSSYQQRQGIALATLKMLQEGTREHPGEQWVAALDAEGAFIENIPDRDFVTFSLYFPQQAAAKVLSLLKEIFEAPLFSAERLELLKFQQRQSLAINMEKTSYLAYRDFSTAIYTNKHPYGRFLSMEDIASWNVEELETFFHSMYAPSEMRIFMAGNLTAEVRQLLDDTLGHLSQRPYSGEEVSDVTESIPCICSHEKNGSVQASLCIGRVLFGRTHADWMRMNVLNRVLGGYFGSRLMTEIRERSGLAYGIYSHIASMRHAGHFYIAADVNAAAAEEAVDKIKRELRRMCEEKIPGDELQRVKKYEFGSLLRSFDGLFQQMERYMDADDYGLAATYWQTYAETLAVLTADELQALACRYLSPETMTVVTVGA